MIKMPNLIEKKIKIARNDRKVAKALTGLSIACIEAFILCPVERLKVILMTRNSKSESTWTILTTN